MRVLSANDESFVAGNGCDFQIESQRPQIASKRRDAHVLATFKARQLALVDLYVARDFLSYLRLVESNDPTLEIMANQQMMDDIRTSRADWRAGRRSRFTPLEKLKRHA